LRIAVASSDGKVVNQHFGDAGRFLIFEVDGETFRFLETRENMPVCNMGHHDEDALTGTANALSDCSFVVASKIGPGAAHVLITRRIRAFVDADFVDKSLAKLLASGKLRRNPPVSRTVFARSCLFRAAPLAGSRLRSAGSRRGRITSTP